MNWGAEESSLIPVCALLTGVNLPDHEDVFEILAEEMSARGAMPHVARVRSAALSSSAAGSGLLQLVQSVVRQLMRVTAEDNSADEREVELKRAKMTLPTLDAWYNNQYPRGGKKSRVSRPPLVVIAEDFEGFGAVVMQGSNSIAFLSGFAKLLRKISKFQFHRSDSKNLLENDCKLE